MGSERIEKTDKGYIPEFLSVWKLPHFAEMTKDQPP